MAYEIRVTHEFESMFDGIRDTRVRSKIANDIDGLTLHPDMQGKPLIGELAGCRSIRSVGQRYRIVYRVEEASNTVWLLGIGLRKDGDKKDVYTALQKLVKNAPHLQTL